MIKIFNHYLHRQTLFQIFVDAFLVFFTVVAAVIWQSGDVNAVSTAITCAGLLTLGLLAINAGLGFYQRVHNRTLAQSRSRAMLSLCLTLPLAYVILQWVPLQAEHQKVLGLCVLAGLLLIMVRQVTVSHSKSQSMLRQRVLVFGTGTRAKLVGRTLQKSDPSIDLVGYYASPNEAVAEVSAWGVLSPNKSLTDIVLEEQVDEIVVALAERRGGSMPLRELLDCKLLGVRVVDIATRIQSGLGSDHGQAYF